MPIVLVLKQNILIFCISNKVCRKLHTDKLADHDGIAITIQFVS